MRNVDVTAPGKLIALSVVVAGCFAYIITTLIVDTGDTTPAWSTLALVVGYLVGNGVGASKGQVTIPPLTPTLEKQREVLDHAIEVKNQAAKPAQETPGG